MPAASKLKKKTKKAKRKTDESESSAKYVSRYEGFDDIERKMMNMQISRSDWVRIDIKLLNWSYANFSLHLRTNTPLSYIKRKIEERHGSITDLQLFKQPPHKNNELKDFSLTLADLKITGGPKFEQNVVTLFYDFKPAISDPLLLNNSDYFANEKSSETCVRSKFIVKNETGLRRDSGDVRKAETMSE